MYIHTDYAGNSKASPLHEARAIEQPTTFAHRLAAVLSLMAAFALMIVGLITGVTMMLVLLGLMPITLIWLWFVKRRTATDEIVMKTPSSSAIHVAVSAPSKGDAEPGAAGSTNG